MNSLLTNINPIEQPIDTLWLSEVQKRKQQIESGKVKLVDGKEVFEKLGLKLTTS